MKMTGPWMGAAAGDALSLSNCATTAYQYNGIEHVDDFDLNVNMAMYRTLDPVIGRWWGVDPAAESFADLSPYNSMGNSPMVYSDPDGDFIHILVGAGIGGLGNLIYQGLNSDGPFTFKDGLAAFGIGAAAGGLAAATGGATLAAMGGAGSAATFGAAIAQGVAVGGIGGMTAGFVQGTGNGVYFQNQNIGDALNSGYYEGVQGAFLGAALGGIGGAISYNGPVSPQGVGPSSGPGGYPPGATHKVTVNGKVIEVPGLEVAATQPTGGLNVGQAAKTGLYNGPVTSYSGMGGNPFAGSTFQQIHNAFVAKGFTTKGPSPMAGKDSYINPKTGTRYYLGIAEK
jgi:RHS repeat-associated protein